MCSIDYWRKQLPDYRITLKMLLEDYLDKEKGEMKMNEDFQKKFAINEYKIHETDHWIWSLRPHQSTLGASILSLKRQCLRLSELTEAEFADLSKMIRAVETTLGRVFQYDIMNYMMLMMVDKLVHYHVFPRYKNSVEFEGEIWEDKSWPNIPPITGNTLSGNKLTEITAFIKKNVLAVEQVPKKKFRCGYTTGVFDLFHVGHLNILRKAKEQCDFLIVGVSTDELVLDYKNKRPVIPFEERKTIIESVKYVDQVVPQISMDKFAAWENLRFDVIFHGDDWKGSKLYEEIERKLKAVGVEMVYFPYTKGTSSTMLGDVLSKISSESQK